MMTTIRDVARQLDLSITTVSRALDGYSDVSEETRKRVIETAHQMGYVPSQAARQLRRKRSEAIGYVLPSQAPRFSHPFFNEFIIGLGDEAARWNFDLLISTAPPGESSEQEVYQRWVQSGRVDGIVLNRLRRGDWRTRYLAEMHVPFAVMGRPEPDQSFPFVCVDAEGGVRKLVMHLAQKGHRRIAYIGGPPDLVMQVDRLAGYRSGLQQAELPIDPQYEVSGDLSRKGGRTAALDLLSRPERPSAIVCVDDYTAIGAIQAAHELGINPGQEVAIAGFDGLAETEDTDPPLTTLAQPISEIAAHLVHMVIAAVIGERTIGNGVFLEPELVLRASTEG